LFIRLLSPNDFLATIDLEKAISLFRSIKMIESSYVSDLEIGSFSLESCRLD
jgi:hypothetical protein